MSAVGTAVAMSAASHGHVGSSGGGSPVVILVAVVLWLLVGAVVWMVYVGSQTPAPKPAAPFRQRGKLIYGSELPEEVRVTWLPNYGEFAIESKVLADLPDGQHILELWLEGAPIYGPAEKQAGPGNISRVRFIVWHPPNKSPSTSLGPRPLLTQ